jgi:hypothetical protein
MNIVNKISPLLSYNFGIMGILSIAGGIVTFIYSSFFGKVNIDIATWLICFGLFCTGYRKEKNEDDDKVVIRRYHAFRISFALTVVIVLIISSSFIFSNESIKMNGLHTLLLICLLFNLLFLIMKIIDKWTPKKTEGEDK